MVQFSPTYCGYLETPEDALILLDACLAGELVAITQRPAADERHFLCSGSVFLFSENTTHIKRWTDNRKWSPSRILNKHYLVYRELQDTDDIEQQADEAAITSVPATARDVATNSDLPVNEQTNFYSRALVGSLTDDSCEIILQTCHLPDVVVDFKRNGLIKKSISLQRAGDHFHIISYYDTRDVVNGLLRTPTQDPRLERFVTRPSHELSQYKVRPRHKRPAESLKESPKSPQCKSRSSSATPVTKFRRMQSCSTSPPPRLKPDSNRGVHDAINCNEQDKVEPMLSQSASLAENAHFTTRIREPVLSSPKAPSDGPYIKPEEAVATEEAVAIDVAQSSRHVGWPTISNAIEEIDRRSVLGPTVARVRQESYPAGYPIINCSTSGQNLSPGDLGSFYAQGGPAVRPSDDQVYDPYFPWARHLEAHCSVTYDLFDATAARISNTANLDQVQLWPSASASQATGCYTSRHSNQAIYQSNIPYFSGLYSPNFRAHSASVWSSDVQHISASTTDRGSRAVYFQNEVNESGNCSKS